MRRKPTAEVSFAGPLINAPETTSSSSGKRRQRRNEGLSEDSAESTTLVESGLIINEDYRSGGPSLVRFPPKTEHPMSGDPLFQQWKTVLEEPTTDILIKYRVQYKMMGPVRRSGCNSDEKHETILISANKGPFNNSWNLAAKNILALFRRNGFMQLNIEILDARGLRQLKTFPIPQDDPFVTLWENTLRLAVLSILGERDWSLLYVVRRGFTDNDHHNTVAITVRETSTYDWAEVREDIVSLLDGYELDSVAVEICRGEIFHGCIRTEEFLDERDYHPKVRMGGSLAPSGCLKSRSTYGGTLRLEFADGSHKFCGLTNFHSVAVGNENHRSYSGWERHGIVPNDSSNNLRVDSPSARDRIDAIDNFQKLLQSAKLSLSVELQKRIEDGDPSVSIQDKVTQNGFKTTIDSLELLLDRVRNFTDNDAFLGPVFAASGLRLGRKDMLLDWALVELSQERVSDNMIPTREETYQHRRYYFPAYNILTGTSSLTENMYLFKIGNRTGFTVGCLGDLRLAADIQGWYSLDNGEQKWVRGKAYVIHTMGHDPFGDEGDSGSFVYSTAGSLLGLYFGGDMVRNTGLLMPIDLIFDDIKELTGAVKVTVP